MTRGKYAVIATRNRPDELQRCIDAIQHQVDMLMVIDNGSDPIAAPVGIHCVIQRCSMQPPNLSMMWNIGLRYFDQVARTRRHDEWDVAILNDDAIPPPGWFIVVADAMRKYDGYAACSGGTGNDPVVYGPEAPAAVYTRVQGWAFILRGESELRADEGFPWWCGDDDLSMQARLKGGLVVVPGIDVPNTLANSTTVGPLLEQSALDMQRFVDKWGVRPW